MKDYYKENGMWNPPETNYLINSVISSFFFLNKKRKFFVPAMGGDIIYYYIDEVELKAYLEMNDKGIELDWFLHVFHAVDDHYVNKYLNKKKETKKGR